MANRGFSDTEGRFDMGGGAHDTEDRKDNQVCDVEGIAGPTTVAEQIARGTSRKDAPCCDDNVPPLRSKFQGGSADGRDRAAYPGTPTPTPGTTY